MNKRMTRLIALFMAALLFAGSVMLPVAGEGTKEYDTETGYPLLKDVLSMLDTDEIIRPDDVAIEAGAAFDLIEKQWFGKDENHPVLQITVYRVDGPNGHSFSPDDAGKYTVFYIVEPVSGHPSYEISRVVTVLEARESIVPETVEEAPAPENPNQDENETAETEVNTEVEIIEDTVYEDNAENDDGEKSGDPSGMEESDRPEDAAQENASDEEDSTENETAESGDGADITDNVSDVSQDEAVDETDDAAVTVQESEEESEPGYDNTENNAGNDTDSSIEDGVSDRTSMEPRETIPDESNIETDPVPGDEEVEGEANEDALGSEPFDDLAAEESDSAETTDTDTNEDEPTDDDAPAEDDPENIVIEGNAKLKRGDKIKYPTDLGSYSTFLYKVDGKIAYCLQSQAASPKDGSFAQSIFDSNKNLNKALYYGYGGPGDLSASFYPDYSGNIRYILTHMAASYFYTGDYTAATYKCTSSGLEKYKVKEWMDYLSEQPDPPSPLISLSKSELSVIQTENGIQITETIRLNADSRNMITLELPDGVSFHNVDTGETVQNGSVVIHGGTSFYFTAPANMDGKWNSDKLSGSIEKVWKVIVIKTGTKTQDLGSYASETYGGSVCFSVEWQGETELTVIKADASDSNLHLAGAKLGIYADEGCTELLYEITTDENGAASVSISRAYRTVYIKELSAPSGYKLNPTVYNVDMGDHLAVTVSVKNEAQKAGLKIYKKGEMLTDAEVSDKGVRFVYTVRKLSGAVYRVTARSNIYGADGALVYQKGSIVVDYARTNNDGEVLIENLPLGEYLVEEVTAPYGYVLSPEKHSVKLEYAGQETELAFDETTFTNDRQKAEIVAYKRDADSRQPLADAQIALYAAEDIYNCSGDVVVEQGQLIETVTTGSDGAARFSADLPNGYSYRVSEAKAPQGYMSDSDDCLFSFTYEDQAVSVRNYSCEFADCAITAKLDIRKVDAETVVSQGDAVLSGAVYGLFARERIPLPDSGSTAYEPNAQVTSLTTDANGEASASGLYPGRYYLKEISPSKGYILDTTEYEVNLTADVNSSTISCSLSLKEQVSRQPFQIIKAVKNAGTNAPLLQGAGFTAWLVSDLKLKPDGSYDLTSAQPVVIGKDGATEIFTDSKGYAVSIPLPYGTYIVRETTTPENYAPVDDFIVTVSENAPNDPQVWRVLLDQEFSAKLRIIKLDSETGRVAAIAGAGFTVYDLDNNTYVSQGTSYPSPAQHTTFVTDESGTLTLPESLRPGRYRVTEVSAPAGYLLNSFSVDITVGDDVAYKIDPITNEPVIEVKLSDATARGRIHISKIGEMLTGYRDGKFIYEECYISGVRLEVHAAENIYSADGQKDENGERFLEIAEDALVCELVTDSQGDAWTVELPLGKYYIVEKQAADGFVLDSGKHYVTLSYSDQETAVVVETVTVSNRRQKAEVQVEKLSANGKLHLSGAVFGLYAQNDIMLNGSVLVPAGTCVATATTGSTGYAVFDVDLPFGKYLLGEIQAPRGYMISDQIHEIDLRWQGQDKEVVAVSRTLLNEPVQVAISKADATTGVELDGAKITLKDKSGKVIESWVSIAGSPHIVEGLAIGETYTLKEDIAPYGYLVSSEVKFTVKGDGTVQKVVMYDDVPTGSIIINKSGEFLSEVSSWDSATGWIGSKFQYIFGSLKDVTFDVYAYTDITHADGATAPYYTAGTKIATIKTDSSGYARLDNLPLGQYYVVETGTADGYIIDDKARVIDLSYRDSSTAVVTYSEGWQNERQKVKIRVIKTDEASSEVLADAVFGLYAGENITVNGNTIIKKDALIEQKATDATGKLSFETDLPIGFEFYIREVMPPAGYASSAEAVFFRSNELPGDMLEAQFTDNVIRVEISKTDIAGEELPGAKLSILNSKGETVESWVSEDKPHRIEMLPVGKYTLREESAPDGYIISEDISFEVKDTGEIQKVTMQNKPVPEGGETPQTGDTGFRYLWLLPIAVGWLGVAFVLFNGLRKRH
ncbi:MAG: peptidase [Clostridiales bacterium]|nr:peptidase [Clostridiales bacterium]